VNRAAAGVTERARPCRPARAGVCLHGQRLQTSNRETSDTRSEVVNGALYDQRHHYGMEIYVTDQVKGVRLYVPSCTVNYSLRPRRFACYDDKRERRQRTSSGAQVSAIPERTTNNFHGSSLRVPPQHRHKRHYFLRKDIGIASPFMRCAPQGSFAALSRMLASASAPQVERFFFFANY